MPGRRRLGAAVVLAGIGAILLGQLSQPFVAAPLFDGVLVEDPYRFVIPPTGAAGDPQPVEVTDPVTNGAVPLIAVATSEVPPQAQIIAQKDAFEVPGDATSVIVSIMPVAPSDQRVAGNVYRFAVTDQGGTPLSIRSSALVTVVLRAPQPGTEMAIARMGDAGWAVLPTNHGGLPDLFAANITALGDYAVVTTATQSGSPAPSSAGAATSAAPSAGGEQPAGGTGPPWIVILLGAGAIGLGLLWGLIGGDEGGGIGR